MAHLIINGILAGMLAAWNLLSSSFVSAFVAHPWLFIGVAALGILVKIIPTARRADPYRRG